VRGGGRGERGGESGRRGREGGVRGGEKEKGKGWNYGKGKDANGMKVIA
jgi:hypothetical protein